MWVDKYVQVWPYRCSESGTLRLLSSFHPENVWRGWSETPKPAFRNAFGAGYLGSKCDVVLHATKTREIVYSNQPKRVVWGGSMFPYTTTRAFVHQYTPSTFFYNWNEKFKVAHDIFPAWRPSICISLNPSRMLRDVVNLEMRSRGNRWYMTNLAISRSPGLISIFIEIYRILFHSLTNITFTRSLPGLFSRLHTYWETPNILPSH